MLLWFLEILRKMVKFALDLKHLDILYVLIPVFQDIVLTFRKTKKLGKKITFFLNSWRNIEALFLSSSFWFCINFYLYFSGENLWNQTQDITHSCKILGVLSCLTGQSCNLECKDSFFLKKKLLYFKMFYRDYEITTWGDMKIKETRRQTKRSPPLLTPAQEIINLNFTMI